MREIAFDIETTGLYVDEGHRLISVGMVEMIDGKETGIKLQFLVNPERESDPEALNVHKMTTKFLSQFPTFDAHAETIRDFIGNDPVVITCRTSDRNGNIYTLDQAFLDAEFARAGVAPLKKEQWINVRRWSEELFGTQEARLDKILDRYGVSRAERDRKGHGALLDAELLAAVYPRLKADYLAFKTGSTVTTPAAPPPKR